jgi:hypothetical protein
MYLVSRLASQTILDLTIFKHVYQGVRISTPVLLLLYIYILVKSLGMLE